MQLQITDARSGGGSSRQTDIHPSTHPPIPLCSLQEEPGLSLSLSLSLSLDTSPLSSHPTHALISCRAWLWRERVPLSGSSAGCHHSRNGPWLLRLAHTRIPASTSRSPRISTGTSTGPPARGSLTSHQGLGLPPWKLSGAAFAGWRGASYHPSLVARRP